MLERAISSVDLQPPLGLGTAVRVRRPHPSGVAGDLHVDGDCPAVLDRTIGIADVAGVPSDATSNTVLAERRTAAADRRGTVGDRRRSRHAYRSLDLTVALTTLGVVFVATNAATLPAGIADFLSMRVTVKNVVLLLVCSLAWLASFSTMGLYNRRVRLGRREEGIRTVIACALGSGGPLLFPLATGGTGALTYPAVLLYWVAVTTVTLALRLCAGVFHRAARQRTVRRVIIIGTGPRAEELTRQLTTDPEVQYHILGFVDTRDGAARCSGRVWNLGFLDELEQTLMHTVVDEVLIALPIKSHYAEIESAIRACERAGVHSKYLADVFKPSLARQRFETSGDVSLMAMAVVQDDYRMIVKRVLDVACIIVTLPAVLPVALCVAAAVKLSSPGPVFFAQERYGRGKRRFRMYKFRTMVAGAEALQQALESCNEVAGPVFKIRNDPRVTRVGRFLRKSSLDELPQLWNVLRGEMSLVGPRPLSSRDVGHFAEPWLMRRFSVQPGLTCLWQISGRSNLSFDRWVSLDLEYIDRWSLALDLGILLRTAPVVLRGVGAA